MTSNPPPLVSPIPGLEVRAVLDQDALLTAGLARTAAGQRVVLLVSGAKARPGEREEFTAWGGALTDIGAVARISAIADYGHTPDGRPYLATYVNPSLSDRLRLVGPPPARVIRGLAATVADALAAAHSYGLVHAAVSPATVLMVDDGVRLGGFGATAPGLTGPLGVWAFTAPEHRSAAAAGQAVGSPAADVFGLAATVCVALAGVLPWSDPTGWADEAGLHGGPLSKTWVRMLRAALSADPDQRPTAEEFAEAMRVPDDLGADQLPGEDKTTRVDLRGLIPRQVRRLAAYSIDAMADGTAAAAGRAVPKPAVVAQHQPGVHTARSYGKPSPKPEDLAPAPQPEPSRFGSALRRHRAAAGIVGAVTAALVAMGVYAWAGHGPPQAAPNPSPSATTVAPDPIATLELLNGARTAGQAFIHDVGVRSDVACVNVHGDKVIITKASATPISCTDLLAHAPQLLGQPALDAMAKALVVQAVGYSDGSAVDPDHSDDPDPHAFISLPFVPSLAPVMKKFEMVLTFRDSQWWVVEVTFG